MSERWTPETELLAKTAVWHVFIDASPNGPDDPDWIDAGRRAAAVLTALADAGLLLPPGTETEQGWAYVSHWRDGSDHIMQTFSEGEARYMASRPPSNPVGVRGRSVARRRIHIEPWETES